MSTAKKDEPMDKSAREGEAVMHRNNPRNTYAMRQMLREVEALMPDIAWETSRRNQRGIAFDVQFDLSSIPEEDRKDFVTLLTLLDDPAYNEDPRIESVVSDTEYVLVSFRNNPVIMDDASPFGLGSAWEVLRGEEGSA